MIRTLEKNKIRDLRVMIPVGGQAIRLKPLTDEVSKAYVRFLNRPLIERGLVELAKQGVQHFIFGVKGYINYKNLHDYFDDGIPLSAKYGITPRIHIKYQPHDEDIGSADSLRIILNYYDITDPILVMQGDNLFDLDLKDMLRTHLQKKTFLTLALTHVKNVEDYGIISLDKKMFVEKFVEKPKLKDATTNLANTGIYLFDPKVREILNSEKTKKMMEKIGRWDFGKDFIPYLVEKNYMVYGYILPGDWYDLGTPANYLTAMGHILQSGVNGINTYHIRGKNYNIWIEGKSKESVKKRNTIIHNIKNGKITFDGSILIGRHCQIGEGTFIRNSSIDNFTVIGDNVVIDNSAIMDRSIIHNYSKIENSIIGRHVIVHSSYSQPTSISRISVIGDDTVIGEGCELHSTKIGSHQTIPPERRMVDELAD